MLLKFKKKQKSYRNFRNRHFYVRYMNLNKEKNVVKFIFWFLLRLNSKILRFKLKTRVYILLKSLINKYRKSTIFISGGTKNNFDAKLKKILEP